VSVVASSPPRLRSLVDAFARGLELSPDGPAIREGTRQVEYRQLNTLIAQLAGDLARLGVLPGERVAVWLPKSIEAIAALQASLRIGAVYVPIDPLSPPQRVRRFLADCRPAACVALAAGVESVFGDDRSRPALLALSSPGRGWETRPARRPESASGVARREPPARPSAGRKAAYILYTSGSTGTPKGVCISHRNALAFIEWARAEVEATAADRFASHAPLHFDLSVFDVYATFLSGACVCLVPEAISFIPAKLVEFVRRERISIWYSVPSALMLMERAGLLDPPPSALRVVLFAGEPFPASPLRRLRRALPGRRLLNLYGPTETNVCSFHEVTEVADADDRPPPIGRSCSGDRIWIEDEAGRPLPVGARGELLVSGPTVMLGYWGAPPQRGPYRTGDVVERIAADEYRYVGRRDAMVKVRGHRIDLGEVEAAVTAHPDIVETAVVVVGEGLERRLVAAAVGRPGAAPGLLEIKRWCAERLPRHMIVHGLRLFDELPRNRNGKLDRRGIVESLAEGEEAR
jgi:amino acid adenylation domain-containing protein